MEAKKKKNLFAVLSGIGIGAVNGFFGGGGGMIVVPLLERALKKETKTAHATAIFIILPISIFSAVTYIVKGSFDLFSGLIAGGGVIAGGILGAFLLSRLSNRVIRIIFDILMIAAAVKLIFF